ncbi:reverse transcriptase domain-containing protein [Tanacetum coccineum]
MSTRSSFSSLIPPFFDPESVIRNQRRNLDDFSRLLDFEEISMNPNNVQGPPPAGLPPQNHNGPPGSNLHMPVPDLCTMEELCQPTMNGRGGSIALVNIQFLANDYENIISNISFSKALAYMPKYAIMVKDLLTNKEKLLELVNTSLNENCSTVLLKKLPEKFGDTERFLIPCKLQELESCMSLADLGASINLMPLSVWEKLTLLELTPTRMTLELATRAVAYLVDIAKDVFVKVGKFTFPADFVVVDYDIDP